MRRRTLIASAAILSSPAAAQASAPLVAFLVHGSQENFRGRLAAFREGMRQLGHGEGVSYRLELRWSDGRLDRLPELARDLLRLDPAVAVGVPVVSVQAFWRLTRSVPLVMAGGAGAIQAGLIASLSRPGGNVTGVTNQGDDLTQKLFQLLRELAPEARRVMAVSSGHGLVEADVRRAARTAAASLDMTLIDAWAATPAEIPRLADLCRREGCSAIIALLDPTLLDHRAQLADVANALRLPAVYPVVEFATDGGLVAYGADPFVLQRRAAVYVDRILKGAKPGDLPVEQPTAFNLVFNLRTATSIGMTIPQSLLLRADEVIE